MGKTIDIIGKKFGKLTTLKLIRRDKNYIATWLCKCDCGNTKEVSRSNLISNSIKSCGCLFKTLDGFSETKFGQVWKSINRRCNDIKHYDYKNYGMKGVEVSWSCFSDFRKDMYKSYLNHVRKYGKEDTTIERINNNGHYSKENCCWATWKEQSRNKSTNHLITFRGKTQPVISWAEELKLNYGTLIMRINKSKWSVEKSLTTPIKRHELAKPV